MGRLCSADLALTSAFYNAKSGKGYSGRIFMNGEEVRNDEVGNGGRAFAHIVSGPGAGISYQLPSLGKFSWENSLASPHEQDKTVVIGTDDSTPGQVYVYIGEKQATGNEIEKAGLHGGSLYGVQVLGFPLEDLAIAAERGRGIASGARFSLYSLGDVRSLTGVEIQDTSASTAAMTTSLMSDASGRNAAICTISASPRRTIQLATSSLKAASSTSSRCRGACARLAACRTSNEAAV